MVRHKCRVTANENPQQGWGGWRGNPSGAVIYLLFARVWRTDQSGRPDSLAFSWLLIAKLQLRDSAGITPASPLADRIELFVLYAVSTGTSTCDLAGEFLYAPAELDFMKWHEEMPV